MSDEPDVVTVKDGDIYHIESSGVTRGINAIPFHWVNRNTGKSVFPSPMLALGQRNLEFRRAEAEKAGYEFNVCSGPECPHH